VHRDIFVQKEPTGHTIYFQFISIINLYPDTANSQPTQQFYYT